MKPLHCAVPLRICLIALLSNCVTCLQLFGQTGEQIDGMQATLEKFLHTHAKPTEPDTIVQQFAADITSTYGRAGAAKIISAVVRERVLYSSQLSAARKIGNELEPEFSRAVFQTLEETGYSLAVGRLLYLLRRAPPEYAQAVARWLSDTRPGDEPDIRNAKASQSHGTPYRVCDIAYNVMTEIQATDKSSVVILSHLIGIAEREAIIAPVRALYPQRRGSSSDTAPKADSSPTKDGHTGALGLSESKAKPAAADASELPGSCPTNWQLWASIAAMLALAASWLVFRLRGKNN